MAKCNMCNIKISILDEIISECKCNKFHCIKHRLPELHNCLAINKYKSDGKEQLAKSLVKVGADKIIKIM